MMDELPKLQTNIEWIKDSLNDFKGSLKELVNSNRTIENQLTAMQTQNSNTWDKVIQVEEQMKILRKQIDEEILNEDIPSSIKARTVINEGFRKETSRWMNFVAALLMTVITTIIVYVANLFLKIIKL